MSQPDPRITYVATTKRRRWPVVLIVLGVTFMAICFGGLFVIATGDPKAPDVGLTSTPSATEAAPKPLAQKPSKVSDGTFKVGEEVKPGTYATTAPEDSFGCYWERLRGFSGELDKDVISNGLLQPGETGRVTIAKSDKGFKSTGGCTWNLVK